MNTAGNRNRDLDEPLPFLHRLLERLLRGLLPPHADNVAAAEFLRTRIGPRDEFIEWVAVRPDALQDEAAVSAYGGASVAHAQRTARRRSHQPDQRGALHGPAAHRRGALEPLKGQMPVIYNRA